MNRDLGALVRARGGVVSRSEALAAVPHHVLDHAVKAGHVIRLFPRVYADPEQATDPWTRARAAIRYAGPDAALSHVTALGVWGLPGGSVDAPVHVLVPASRRPRSSGDSGQLVIHRRRGFNVGPPRVVVRSDLPTCRLELGVVDSWTMLAKDTRRAAVIAAVGDRKTTPDRLLREIGENPNLPDRQELLRLVHLLERGCRSELELYGYDRIFTGPGMPELERNVPIKLGRRTVYLDTYCPAARVNFELDGAKWHRSARAWERDRRRDAALAALGIMVVRFTHDQLLYSPELVRAQIRAVIANRLR